MHISLRYYNSILARSSQYKSVENKMWFQRNFTKLNGRRSQFDDNPPYAQLRRLFQIWENLYLDFENITVEFFINTYLYLKFDL